MEWLTEDCKWRQKRRQVLLNEAELQTREVSPLMWDFLRSLHWSGRWALKSAQTHLTAGKGEPVGEERRFLTSSPGCCQRPAAPKPEKSQMKAAGTKVEVQLQLLCIWNPLPCVRSLAPTWATVVKHTAARAPLSALPPPPIWFLLQFQRWLQFPSRVPQRQSPPLACKPHYQPSGKALLRVVKANHSRAAYLLGIQSAHVPAPAARPQSLRPPACGPGSPRPAPHLPAAAAAPPARAHEVILPGGSPHSAPAAGGERPPPAAGKGAWDPRPTTTAPPGVRVISC